ncbi:hypothetical protein PsYK624_049980 [Phanerochaete sordida]|uniref:DUF6533 domain-containing protein n=1 Tax=Phanerochaete sordida TaxID=48140 RepID=A0A9P3G6V8_9APHY|nr:hypothetical protein PsYK624_049980 [Phanerochaete sordida]
MGETLADAYYQMLVQEYIGVALTCLVVYEYIITFGQEVETVWRRKMNVTSLLIVTTRWVLVLIQITLWLASWPKPDIVINDLLVALGYLQIALFSALRAFALSSRSYVIFTVVFMFGLVPVWTDTYDEALSAYTWLPAPFNICSASPHFSQAKYGMVFVTRSFLIASDVIVLVITWLKTYRQWREARRIHLHLSMSSCLLRDGTVYFIALLAMNIAHMATYNTVISPMSNIINVLPGIFVVRFMFNLRALDGASATPSASAGTPSQLSGAHFAVPSHCLGNIGGTLDHWQRAGGAGPDVDVDSAATCIAGTSSDTHDAGSAERCV